MTNPKKRKKAKLFQIGFLEYYFYIWTNNYWSESAEVTKTIIKFYKKIENNSLTLKMMKMTLGMSLKGCIQQLRMKELEKQEL